MNGRRPGKPFFGWAIVGFAFTAQFLTMGTLFYAFSPLLKPLTQALDANRFEVSIALSLQSAQDAAVEHDECHARRGDGGEQHDGG